MTPVLRLVALMIALLTLGGLAVQFLATSAHHPEETVPQVLWRMARYFTILTNAMVAGGFGWMAARGRWISPFWQGGLALWIGIVGVVYWLLLAKPLSGLDAIANWGLHALTPALTLLWWLIAAPKKALRPGSALGWMVWPLLYLLYALLRGQLGGVYPYFFVDPGAVGWDGVLWWSALLCAGIAAAGGVQIWVARLLR